MSVLITASCTARRDAAGYSLCAASPLRLILRRGAPLLAILLILAVIWPATLSVAGDKADAGNYSSMDVDLNGWFESSNHFPLRETLPQSLRQRLWGEITVRGPGPFRAFASGYLDADFATRHRDSDEDLFTLEANEAHVTLDLPKIDVTVGLQQIRWGDADSMSTVDVINPVDYRNPVATGRSTSRLSVPAIDVRADVGLGMLDLVCVPVPTVSRMARHGSPWEPRDLKAIRRYEKAGFVELRDGDEPKSPEFGGRLKFYRQGFDMALIYYHGYEHTPLYTWEQQKGSYKRILYEQYRMYDTFGISTAISLENSTLRSEFAFKAGYPFQGKQDADFAIYRRNDFQFLLGWDRTFLANLVVNVQGFFFHHDGAREVPGIDRSRYGLSFNIENKFFDESLRSGIRGIYYMNNQDLCLEWFNEYDYDDHWKFNFGVMFLSGNSNESIGQFKNNDYAYIGFKYLF